MKEFSYELLVRIYLISLPYIESSKRIRPIYDGKDGIQGKLKHDEMIKESSKLTKLGIISEFFTKSRNLVSSSDFYPASRSFKPSFNVVRFTRTNYVY
jgi:hypothetical protein